MTQPAESLLQPAVATGPSGFAAVAAGSQDTAYAAIQILEQGGNAVDAAVGATLAASVAEVVFTSLGGGGFLLVKDPGQTPQVVDFFTNTPGLGRDPSAPPAEFTPITVRFPGADQVFHAGPGSVAVPGALAGLFGAQQRYGRLPVEPVVASAIELAREGAVLEPVQATVLKLVREIMSLTSECKALISNESGYLRAGDRIYNRNLADFLQVLCTETVRNETSATFADPLIELMTATNGKVTATDLLNYGVATRPPLHVQRDGVDVWLNSPPAFGGQIIAGVLRSLRVMDRDPASWGQVIQRLRTETAGTRKALADQPLSQQGTTHISVVDADGQVAAMTTSNGSGSGVVVPGTGIHLNNMLGEEDLNPPDASPVPPGLRIGSMMTPTILQHPDGTTTGLGTGGSERIRSAILTTLLRLIDLGQAPDDAIGSPRLHPEPAGLQAEPGWDIDLASQAGPGCACNIWPAPDLYFGGVHAVTRFPDGSVQAVGDSRRGGAAMVVQTKTAPQ